MITVTKSDLPPLEEYIEHMKKIWASAWVTNNGEYVQLLQRKLEKHLKTKHLVLVSNGTLAIELALRGLEIRGEVITTPFTFPATTNAILWERLTPVFADIDPETFNIDPKEVEKRITRKTGAILATHTFGNPCHVKELQEIASRHDVKLIYDAAATFGVEYENHSVLDYGDMSTLSFHATKVFHTIEGGAIAVKDETLSDKLRLLLDHGIESAEHVAIVGTNAKMNEFQAVMGICNLKYVDEKIQRRKRLYEHYKRKLSKYVKFQKLTASKYNYGYMPVCFGNIEERDEVHLKLLKNRIDPRKYFFPLTTSSDYFKKECVDLVKKYDLRKAYDLSNRILCLPLYPDLKTRDVNRVIKIIEDTLDTKES
jgi:dTDP-4-amino-4,6-dideoxygalactose transaminase